uniref:Tail protein n=1 Tax=Pseudomonas phage Pavpe01 TaxID=3138545 RepID=A0AAU6W063_9VIRU
MPMILPVIAIGIAAIVGTTTALVIGTIVAVGLTLALSKSMSGVASQGGAGASATSYTTNPTQLTFSADAPRRMVYGRSRVSGIVAYANVAGDGYEYLYMVVIMAAHQITEITQIYFDGDAGPDVANGFYDYWYYNGTQTTVDPTLNATFPEWTSACLLQGCAYAVVRLKYDKTVWKNGRPNIQFDIKGKPVYDPRDGVTRWCNNGALITADFMTSADGLGATSAEMDWPSVIAAANIADQIPETMAASLCDGRYTVDGVIELSAKNGDTISQMLSACAGTVVWTEGKYKLFVGASVAPVSRPITAEDLRDNPSLQPRTPSDQSFNSIKGRFLDSTNGWIFNDFPPVTGAEYVAQDGGVVVYKDIALNLTTSPITAQRLATIFLRRARLEKTITLPCKWTVFNYEVWDVVPINLPQLGWISKLFQITDWKMTPPTNNDPGGIELTLVEYSDAIYSDDMDLKPIDGGGQIIVPDVTQPRPLSVLYATSGATAIDPATNGPRIRFDWPQSSDIYAVGYEIAYGKYPYTPTDAQFMYVAGRNSLSWTTPVLNAGDTYIGYIRVVNSYEKRSADIASNAVVVQGIGTNVPEPLQGLTYTAVDSLYADLAWSPPVGSAASTVIMWAPTNDYETGVIVATIPLPTTTLRVQRDIQDGYYFAAFQSVAGLTGAGMSVAAPGRTPATVLQTANLSKYQGDLTNAIWVNSATAVVKSTKLASELGWEVFDMMVPQPYGTVEYWTKAAVYQAPPATLRVSGSVGWARAPEVPGVLPFLGASAKLEHFASTEYQQGQFELNGDANIRLGFQATVTDPQGVKFVGFNGTLEKL